MNRRQITGTQWAITLLCILCSIMWGIGYLHRSDFRRRIGELEREISSITSARILAQREAAKFREIFERIKERQSAACSAGGALIDPVCFYQPNPTFQVLGEDEDPIVVLNTFDFIALKAVSQAMLHDSKHQVQGWIQ